MYCSECGNAIRTELNYCNRCGAEVLSRSSGNIEVASNLSNVVGAIGVFGFLSYLAVLYLLLSNGIPWPGVTWISLFYLFALSMICSRILKLIGAQSSKPIRNRAWTAAPGEIDAPVNDRLIDDRGTPASVVEHTTRSLDYVPAPRK